MVCCWVIEGNLNFTRALYLDVQAVTQIDLSVHIQNSKNSNPRAEWLSDAGAGYNKEGGQSLMLQSSIMKHNEVIMHMNQNSPFQIKSALVF